MRTLFRYAAALVSLFGIVVTTSGEAHATVTTISSTVPANGDVNPYGVAVVHRSIGNLVAGNILVSNFNAKSNLQGTGTTIVEISPAGGFRLFAHIRADQLPGSCPGGVGLTTALSVLANGWVFVGSLPTSNGMAGTAKAGCILVLDSLGNVVETFSGGPINGPWDMTAIEGGPYADLFVTNVLNGTVAAGGRVVHRGTVLRLALQVAGKPRIISETIIGSGFPERTDPSALVIGPTGVGLSPDNTRLYVADSLDNRIASISNPLFRTVSAGMGSTVSSGGALNDPLGLAVGPGGDIFTVNGADGFLVRTTPAGNQVQKVLLNKTGTPPGSGALFGLAIVPGVGVYFVDDVFNELRLFH